MRFTAIARVTEDRWTTCASKDDLEFGLGPGDELKVETTICNEVRANEDVVVIDDASASPVYCNHPTPILYGFRSYMSVPILLSDGSFFGTLCAIDPEPRDLSSEHVVGLFRLFAGLIASGLEATAKLDRSVSDLAEERTTANLREEFIAVVAHDLRNPIAALSAGLRQVSRRELEAQGPILQEIQHIVHRMASLVENLMDFARGRLGGGLNIETDQDCDLAQVIESIVSEAVLASGQEIETEIDLPDVVRGDAGKLGQLASNLLSNAVAYGDRTEPGERSHHRRCAADRRVEQGTDHPGRAAGQSVRAVCPRAEPASQGVGPRASHRLADRKGA